MDYKVNAIIENLSRKNVKKDGTPYIDKNRKPFSVVSIKISAGAINDPDWNGWCSFMDYSNDFTLNQGQMLKGYISKRSVDTSVFWNFRKPSKIDELEERIIALEEDRWGTNGKPQPAPVEEEQVPDEYSDTPIGSGDDDDLDLPF